MKINKNVYVLHDFDGRPYYKAIEERYNVIYLNTRPFRFLLRDLIKFKSIKKDTLNSLYFFFFLPFYNKRSFILAMAPFNVRLIYYGLLVFRNKVYYHTSWPNWNGSVPFNLPILGGSIIQALWKFFLSNFQARIAVTLGAQESLSDFLNGHIVHQIPHVVDVKSISASHLQYKFDRDCKHVGYLGRLDTLKGIIIFFDIFEMFRNNDSYKFFCVGQGKYTSKAKELSSKYQNMEYLGYISDRDAIRDYLSDLDILLVPSIRCSKWEELFGLVIIEAMSQGVVVVSSDHVGPVSIIDNTHDGFLFSEDSYFEGCIDILKKDKSFYKSISINALKKSKRYDMLNISRKWNRCLGSE